MPAADLAFLPSPSRSVWELGPIPIRAYALCIILGIVAAIWIGERRWVARGGRRGTVSDIAVWAVVFGLIGGRIYHVVTDNELYFREGRDPWRALYVWEGGLGIWGAIALGGVGAWIGCRRRGIKLPPFADAVAPGIAVAHAIGRWGNWFNQELFGRPTDVPWAVEIDPSKPNTVPGATTYHPTFLYESLWTLGLAGVLIWADRRFRMGRGRVFALYVMGYTAGRVWIETLRIDSANTIFGVRLNVWTSIVVFAGGLVYFLLHRGPRETVVEPAPESPTTPDSAAAQDTSADPATSAEPGSGQDASGTVGAGTDRAGTTTGGGTSRTAGSAGAEEDPGTAARDAEMSSGAGTATTATSGAGTSGGASGGASGAGTSGAGTAGGQTSGTAGTAEAGATGTAGTGDAAGGGATDSANAGDAEPDAASDTGDGGETGQGRPPRRLRLARRR